MTIAVIAGIGADLLTLGVAGTAASVVFGGIATILSRVGTAFGMVAAVIGALLTPVGGNEPWNFVGRATVDRQLNEDHVQAILGVTVEFDGFGSPVPSTTCPSC